MNATEHLILKYNESWVKKFPYVIDANLRLREVNNHTHTCAACMDCGIVMKLDVQLCWSHDLLFALHTCKCELGQNLEHEYQLEIVERFITTLNEE